MTGSLNAYARHRKAAGLAGGSLTAVQKAMAAGRISVARAGADYLVDFAAADAQWTANTHQSQGKDSTAQYERPPASPHGQSHGGQLHGQKAERDKIDAANNVVAAKFNVGRAAKMAYEAATAELNYRERLGELVERSKEESRARSLAQEVKDAILGVPDRISPLLAAEPDPMRVHIMLTDELIIALDRLSTAEE